MSAISVRQLSVTFSGRFRRPATLALQQLDLDVQPGEILGILGPNGSGKTTLLRVLAGLQRATRGEATLLGKPPEDPSIVRLVAWQPAGAPPLAALSGREFLQWHGAQLGLANAEADARAAAWIERFQLEHAKKRAVRSYSTGMQRRLMLAASLLGDPEVMLLDEPTNGLDPLGAEIAMEALRERSQRGTAILMASHLLQEVELLCSRLLVLQDGRAILSGTLDELTRSGEEAFVARGLDDKGATAVIAAITCAGGAFLRREPHRVSLHEFYRRLAGREKGPS